MIFGLKRSAQCDLFSFKQILSNEITTFNIVLSSLLAYFHRTHDKTKKKFNFTT